jgi:signal transduction histidine kinase
LARSVNMSELLESDRWVSFIESTATGLQLELLIISQDNELTIKASETCPFCQRAAANLLNIDLKNILINLNEEFRFDNGPAVFASPLQNGLIMLAWECSCIKEKVFPLLANRGRVAAKLLKSFLKALTEGFEGGQHFRLLNKQLNQVLGAVSSAVLLIDQSNTITFANRRAEILFKKPDAELIGSHITSWKGPWLSHLRSETGASVRGEMECFTRDTDPESRCWVDWQISPLLEGSNILGWLLLLDDRTDFYRWQDAARKAERFATTATMVGALAHELRNPISAAKGLLQLMGRKSEAEQTRNYTNLVLRELDRVTSLLNEFLLLGKPSTPDYEPLNLAMFLQELMPLFQGEANGTEVEISLKIESEVSPIIADPGQLTQVMLNLVRNAIQAVVYTGSVTIVLRESNGFVYIEVSDDGPGLSAEVLNNLFQPFFSTKERGTGLGLPIVQAIVHNHGGEIIPFNHADGGTVFSMSFPAAEKSRAGLIDVLIAANDKQFTYPLERALISLGINVITCKNLEKVISEARQNSPTVVILGVTDVQKSQELISNCREHWPMAKILLLTQSLLSSIHTDCQQDGGSSENLEFVTFEYPVDLTRVVSTTRRILGR